jgi:BMFP domain-containing protein YqiC
LNDVVLGVTIKNGISETDFNQNQIDKLRAIGRFEFEVLNDCIKCSEKDSLIKALDARIEDLEEKFKKRK